MSLPKLIKNYLTVRGILNDDWQGYVGKMPDNNFVSDNAVAIIETPATLADSDSAYISDGIPLLTGGIKIVVRGIDHKQTMLYFEKLCRELDLVTNVELVDDDGKLTTIQTCRRQGGIQYMGYCGSNRRHLASITYAVTLV